MLITWRGMEPFSFDSQLTVTIRAAWQGTRILLRQTSPEAEGIFDLILTLNKEVKGNWRNLLGTLNFTEEDLDMLLEYFAMFLANIGNYRVRNMTSLYQYD